MNSKMLIKFSVLTTTVQYRTFTGYCGNCFVSADHTLYNKMANRYLDSKTTTVYATDPGEKNRILIFGDYVKTLSEKNGNKIKVKYGVTTDKTGWIREDRLTNEASLEFYFIDVGQGDSTFIVTPKRKTILIDGGKGYEALKFLAWKYKLKQVSESKPVEIDLLVMTHADEDHLKGLNHIISSKKIKIKQIIHSGLGLYEHKSTKIGDIVDVDGTEYIADVHDKLEELDESELKSEFVRWKRSIEEDNPEVIYRSVNSDTEPIDIGDSSVMIEVLGPRIDSHDGNPMYKWFDDDSHTINGHSVILSIKYRDVRCLLPGDLEESGARFLIKDKTLKQKMDAHILKAPHHGSHEFDSEWLDAVNPQITVISSGEQPNYGHPRGNFLGAIGNSSRKNPLVFSTELAATFSKIGKNAEKELELKKEQKKVLTGDQLETLRQLFKKTLPGTINVRTNGRQIYSARKIAGKHWESYRSELMKRSISEEFPSELLEKLLKELALLESTDDLPGTLENHLKNALKKLKEE